jgi:hypothetical protein
MSEHAWVLENIASYTAGGLEAAECERLEQHTASCEACARSLEEARVADQKLEALFEAVRPGHMLEDRMIRSLREARLRLPMFVRISVGAAAVLLVGVLGAGMSSVIQEGNLPFPGTEGWSDVKATNNLKQLALALHSPTGTRGGEALGDRAEQIVSAAEDGLPRDPEFGAVNQGWKDVDELAASTRKKSVMSLDETRSMSVATNGEAGLGRSNYAGGDVREWARLPHLAPREGALSMPPLAGELSTKELASTGKEGERKPVAVPVDAESDGKKLPKGEGRGPGSDPHYTYRDALSVARTEMATPPMSGLSLGNYFKPSEDTEKLASPSYGFINNYDPKGAKQDQKTAPDASKPPEGTSQSLPPEPQKPGENKKPNQEAPPPAAPRKIIIRSGEIEFEIESFDSAVATITKLIGASPGAFIATVNSEKLPNGKVRGSVVVRIPPERLDSFVLDLRKELGKGGELKGQRIGSQDITKQYTDLESRLRAARAMEERLLNIIKTGKGEIKDLLQAEKELGVWRTKIEEIEGELRYYGNLVSLSTLTITLSEKEIRAPYAISETERIQMGIEVEDVEKAQQAALAAVAEAKGRITKSELKQLAAGQFSALLHFEVAPASAGLVRDRFKQLGTLARLEIDRLQQTEGGSGPAQDAKVKHKDAQFLVNLYNLANVAPRETLHINLACVDTEMVYKTILARVQKSAGRVLTSNLDQQRNGQTTGVIAFEVKTAEADAVLGELKGLGEVMHLKVTENPDAQNVTRSKRGFNAQLWSLAQVAPRETSTIQLATEDVPAGYRKLQDAIAKAKGRVLNAQLNEQDKQNITAQLDFEVRRADETAVATALSAVGDIYSRNVVRAQDSENVVDSKVRLQVSFINSARIPPRETYILGIEVESVDRTAAFVTSFVNELKGRTVESHFAKMRTGDISARLVFDVPMANAPALVDKFKSTGTVRVLESLRNPQVPESELAIARINVTLSNTPLIVASDEGIWPQVRRGLTWSFKALAFSLSWLIVGVCVVLPWALVIYGIGRMVARMRRRPGSVTPAA